METFFCKSVLSWHNFINNRCVKLKSSAMRKTRLAPKKKITQLFSPHVLLQYLPPFLHTYQLCHLFPAETTYAVLLCRDKRLAFDKVTTDSKVKPYINKF